MKPADIIALTIGAMALISLLGREGERDPFGVAPAPEPPRERFLSRPFDRQ